MLQQSPLRTTKPKTPILKKAVVKVASSKQSPVKKIPLSTSICHNPSPFMDDNNRSQPPPWLKHGAGFGSSTFQNAIDASTPNINFQPANISSSGGCNLLAGTSGPPPNWNQQTFQCFSDLVDYKLTEPGAFHQKMVQQQKWVWSVPKPYNCDEKRLNSFLGQQLNPKETRNSQRCDSEKVNRTKKMCASLKPSRYSEDYALLKCIVEAAQSQDVALLTVKKALL